MELYSGPVSPLSVNSPWIISPTSLSLITIYEEILLYCYLQLMVLSWAPDLFLQPPKAQWHMMSQTWRVIFPSRPGLPPRLPISVKSHNYPPIVQIRKLSVIFFTSHLSSLTRLPRPFKTWFLPLFPALFLPSPDILHLAVITPLQFLEWTSSFAFSVFPVSEFVCFQSYF